MQLREMERYRAVEGLHGLMRPSGFLHDFMQKAGTSLKVTRTASNKLGRLNVLDMDLELEPGQQVDLPHCEGVSFHVGAIRRPPNGYVPWVNMRLVHDPDSGNARGALQGDLSVLLPSFGLIPVGTVPPDFTLAGRPTLRLIPDSSALLGKSQIHLPLGLSKVVVDDARNHINVTPAVNLHGRIYRIGNAGVLVSFENMTFACDGSKPRVDFHGGRIWQVKQ